MPEPAIPGLDSVARRFEQAWASSTPPLIDDFLTLAPAADRHNLLIDLIAIDLDRRHCRGDSVALADYLARFPDLGADSEAVVRLAACEYSLLHQQQPHLRPEDYARQFPGCSEAIVRRLADGNTHPTAFFVSPSQPGDRLGDYELLEVLGTGGMGVVYKARHTRLRKLVALKLLRASWASEPDAAARFEREAEAIGRLEHPNLVRATDAREVHGTLLLAMELLEGEPLDKRTKRLGPWPISDACDAVRQAAVGLQHAHEQGLVHRDLKPSNLFLTTDGVVKVLDLGLARLRQSGDNPELTTPGAFMGTSDYAAPEQIQNSRLADVRSDLYSLGCVLYYLLAGRAPFDDGRHTTVNSKLQAHLSEPPPRLDSLRRDVPADLAAVLEKLLAKRPEDRYASAAEAAAALAPFVVGQPGQPSAITTAPRPQTGPFIGGESATATVVHGRGKRILWLWGLVFGVLLAAGISLAWWPRKEDLPPPTQPEPLPPLQGFVDLMVERIDRNKGPQWKRLDEHGALPLRKGDHLRIVVEDLSRSAYLYVIWIDTTGKAIPFYPWTDDQWKWPDVEQPVEKKLELPLDGRDYENQPGPAGTETILLLASDTPLSRSESLDQRLAGLMVPSQSLVPDEAMWFKDWKLDRFHSLRAPHPTKTVEHRHPAERMHGELQRRLGPLFGWSRAVAFGNVGGE